MLLLLIFDKMEKFKQLGADQDTTCNTSIDDTVNFVYGDERVCNNQPWKLQP